MEIVWGKTKLPGELRFSEWLPTDQRDSRGYISHPVARMYGVVIADRHLLGIIHFDPRRNR